MPALYRGLPLQPDDPADPYVFRLDLAPYGLSPVRVVFGPVVDGHATRVHTDLGGQPWSLIRAPDASPRRALAGLSSEVLARWPSPAPRDLSRGAEGNQWEIEAMKMEAADLVQLRRDATDMIIFHATPREWLRKAGPWVLDHGEGALLYDADGGEYLDALSGGVFAVLAGYGREEIAQAMYEQARRLPYTSPYGTTSAVTVELARKLAELTPGDLGASFFCNSGSEAVEAAIKLARQFHEANGEGRRYKVVSLRRAYHGCDRRRAVGDRLEPRLRRLPTQRGPVRSRCRVHECYAAVLLPVRAGADVSRL